MNLDQRKVHLKGSPPKAPAVTRTAPWWIRAVFVAIALVIWFWSQSLIGKRAMPEGGIGDGLHRLLSPWHDFLYTHVEAANALLIVSSAIIDGLALFLFGSSIFGKTIRPFLGVVIVLSLRQICQGLCALPPPEQMIWRNPGFPSLLVTYGVSNDLFFSGHTAVAVLGAIELARTRIRGLAILGVAIALFEAITVLTLRAHYTMDVFTGAMTALVAAYLAQRLAPFCDATINRLVT